MLVAVALGALAAGLRAGQQAAPAVQPVATGSGVIIGTVIDAATGKPIAGAVVSLGGRGAAQPPVMVGRDGRFVFRDLTQASYALVAARTGYFGGGAGQRAPTGPRRPVELGDGERVGDVLLRLWRYGVIGGRVIDDTGEPAVALRVGLLERLLDNGQWRLQERQSTRTDDRGQYRFGKVTPGHYVVSVRQDPDSFMESVMTAMAADISALTGLLSKLMMAGGPPDVQFDFRARVIPMTFAPSAAVAADAAPVAIGPGDDRSQIDVRVASVPTYRVAGSIAGPETTPPNLSIQLISPSLMDQPVGINLAEGRGGGRFDIAGVPPGQYTLRAIAPPRPTPTGATRGGGPGQISATAGRAGGRAKRTCRRRRIRRGGPCSRSRSSIATKLACRCCCARVLESVADWYSTEPRLRRRWSAWQSSPLRWRTRAPLARTDPPASLRTERFTRWASHPGGI